MHQCLLLDSSCSSRDIPDRHLFCASAINKFTKTVSWPHVCRSNFRSMSSSVTCRPIACQKHLILFRSLMRIAFHMAILMASVTSESLLTDVDCQVTGVSTTYQACMSSPEHLVQSQAASCYVNVSPDGSTCGLTRQRYCTLVT